MYGRRTSSQVLMRRDQRCVAQALFSASMLPYFFCSQAMKRLRAGSEYETRPLPVSLL
jgi:hypothetical protein